ncbi:hypothetical protein X777_08566 [Ooceraea biroi]|uniref:Uncharacterized protein n=1 Tax=Ooceraea biroi TaxID=2015173 RepID=A0A026W8W3_OOCBI|nr:hypothetical protein X777_08566 [Ooceraea biroi]
MTSPPAAMTLCESAVLRSAELMENRLAVSFRALLFSMSSLSLSNLKAIQAREVPSYQVQDAGDDAPYGLRLLRGESQGGHGGADGFVIGPVGAGRLALVADEVVRGRVTYQPQLVQFGLAAAAQQL